MSDSESEGEFESADEGEVNKHQCEGGDHLDGGCSNLSNQTETIEQITITDDIRHDETLESETKTVEVLNKTSESEKEDSVDTKSAETERESQNTETVESTTLQNEDENWGWEVEEDVLNTEVAHDKTKSLFDKLSDSTDSRAQSNSGWGWGSWSSSLLATASVFTTQVGQGLSTVLESSLGAPAAEELAKQSSSEETTKICEESTSSLTLTSLVSGVSSLTTALEKTSSKVITGGLNTLEMLGKKTMDIIQEGDPGLKNKRAFMKGPNLSEILREAKSRNLVENEQEEATICFSSTFDEYQGLIHLEALEMLSSQCEKKVQMSLLSVNGEELQEMQHSFQQIKNILTIDESEEVQNQQEFVDLIAATIPKLHTSLTPDKLLKATAASREWLEIAKLNSTFNAKEIHDTAVRYLAEFCARIIEIIHKLSELLLLENDSNPIENATNLVRFVSSACEDVQLQASTFTALLNDCQEDCTAVSNFVTNIFLEATNCSTYIQDALQLLTPIFQFQLSATFER